jgi:hypothetical protein
VLHEHSVQAGSRKLANAEGPGEIPSLVSRWLELEQLYILQLRRVKQHLPDRTPSMGPVALCAVAPEPSALYDPSLA